MKTRNTWHTNKLRALAVLCLLQTLCNTVRAETAQTLPDFRAGTETWSHLCGYAHMCLHACEGTCTPVQEQARL